MQAASRRWCLWLALLLLLGLGLRIARWTEERAGPLARAPAGDEGTYDRWAQRIAGGEQTPQVPYMGPLQAWSLAAWHAGLPPEQARDGQRLLQLLLGTLTAGAAALLGRRLGGPRGGLLAAACVALHPSLIYHEATLLRDGPATLLVAVGCLALVRLVEPRSPGGSPGALLGAGLLLGLAWGVAALCRENLLVVAGAGLLALLPWAWRAPPGGARLGRGAALAGAALGLWLPLLPVLASNARLEGRWEPFPTWNAGCVFYLSNRAEVPGATYLRPGFVAHATPEGEQAGFAAEAERRAGRPLTPHEVSRFWLARGLDDVREDPLRYAGRVARRVLLFLSQGEMVHARDLRLDAARSRVLSLPLPGLGLLLGLAVVGLLGARDRPAARALGGVLLLLLLSTAAVAFASRYRLPAVPLLAALAGRGARDAVQALRAGRPGPLALALLLALVSVWLPVPYATSQVATARENEALAWMELGEPERAFASLEAIPPGEPRGGAWTRLAAALLPNGEPALAADAAGRAVVEVPWHAGGWLHLGLALEALGRPGAEAAFARGVALDPRLAGAWSGLARCRARRGDAQGAAQALRRARAP